MWSNQDSCFSLNHAENIRNHLVGWPGFTFFLQIKLEIYGISEWSNQDSCFSSKFSRKYTESLSGVIRIHLFHPNSAENVRNHRVEWSGSIFLIQIKLEIYGITVWSDQNSRCSSKFSWRSAESLSGVIRIQIFHSNSAINIRNRWGEWSEFIFLMIANWCMLVDTECVDMFAQAHPLVYDVSYYDTLRMCFSSILLIPN